MFVYSKILLGISDSQAEELSNLSQPNLCVSPFMSRSSFPTFIIIVVPHPEDNYLLLEIVSKFYFTANYCSKLTVK